MSPSFVIECEWSDPVGTAREIAETTAFVGIRVGDRYVTQAVNDFSKSVTNQPLLSAYPLAMWFAASWWRLRWETSRSYAPSDDWRMSHELAAAGGGFVWPGLVFESDREFVRIQARPSAPSALEPLRYIESFHSRIPAGEFERGALGFIDLVCARLMDRGCIDTPLQGLSAELLAERKDAGLARLRKTEAILGFDPGEGDDGIIERFKQLDQRAGPAASQEIAHAAAGARAGSVLTRVVDSVAGIGLLGRFDPSLRPNIALSDGMYPWDRGYWLARQIRESCALGAGALSDESLASLLGLQEKQLRDSAKSIASEVGLAVRGDQGDHFHFRKRHPPSGRRFEAARILSDHCFASDSDHWLPETDAHTARQQAQRAFAAEFLCPFAALQEFLGDDRSESRIEDAAEHFQVSDHIVRKQLENNQVTRSGLFSY